MLKIRDLFKKVRHLSKKKNIYTNAPRVAELTGKALDRGRHFRRAVYYSLNRIMKSGSKGAKIILGEKKSDSNKYYVFKFGTISSLKNSGVYRCERNPIIKDVYVAIAKRSRKNQRDYKIREMYSALTKQDSIFIN